MAMNYKLFIKKIYDKLVIRSIKNTEEVPNLTEWYALLNRIGHDTDPIQEAYRKHICRMYYFSPLRKMVINVLSFLYLIIQPYRIENKHIRKEIEKTAILVERESIPSSDIFPNTIYGTYNVRKVIYEKIADKKILTKDIELLYLSVKKQFWMHPYFLLQIKQSLSVISNCILEGDFQAIIVYDSERDIASPIITNWLKTYDIEYISFMHGDYLLQLIQAHMCFSKYYVWNKAYIEMFSDKLKCNIIEYEIYTPGKLQKKWNLEIIPSSHYLTYYLSGESEKSLESLVVIFNKLNSRGLVCKVRPHPRYSYYEKINRMFDPSMIEDPHNISLKESLASTSYVVGLSTTVLNEAFIEGKEIVIDDITDVPHYNDLKDRFFIALQLPHINFSDLVAGEITKPGDMNEQSDREKEGPSNR